MSGAQEPESNDHDFVPPTSDYPFYTFRSTGRITMSSDAVRHEIEEEGVEEALELKRIPEAAMKHRTLL